MKSLKDYIVMENSWVLNIHQRNAFSFALGAMLGDIGEPEEIELFAEFKKSLSKSDEKKYRSIYDALTDEFAYKTATSKIFKSDNEFMNPLYLFLFVFTVLNISIYKSFPSI